MFRMISLFWFLFCIIYPSFLLFLLNSFPLKCQREGQVAVLVLLVSLSVCWLADRYTLLLASVTACEACTTKPEGDCFQQDILGRPQLHIPCFQRLHFRIRL